MSGIGNGGGETGHCVVLCSSGMIIMVAKCRTDLKVEIEKENLPHHWALS